MSLVAALPARTATPAPVRHGVPWATVLPLAAVMAYADGFWMTSLRGAVGVVGRAQGPYGTWWRESTVVLPVFVLAVLAAMALALWWFGPVVRRRTTVATALLVTMSGSVVGVAELVVSSAYDYHLQIGQLRAMARMSDVCRSCLHQQQQATLAVHLHAVWYVSRWVVLTNLVLVVWAVALLGGRLRLRADRVPLIRGASERRARTRAWDLRVLIAAALTGAAAIHAAVIPAHLAEWPLAGAFFAVLTAAQLAVAAAVVGGPWRTGAAAAAAMIVSVVPVLVWAWSRTVGLPIGPNPRGPEAIGLPDCVSGALEVVALSAAVLLLRASGWSRRLRLSTQVMAFALVMVVASVSLAIVAAGVLWPGLLGGSGAGSGMAGVH